MQTKCGDWLIDERANLLQRGEEKVRVESRLMNVLSALVEAKGDVVSKDALIDKVWNSAAVSDHSVANAVSELRKLLGDDAKAPMYIETVPKKGYRLVAVIDTTSCNRSTAQEYRADQRWLRLQKIGLIVFVVLIILFLWVDGSNF